MEKLDERISLQFLNQCFGLLFKIVHLGAHFILLFQHVVSHLVQSVVENLENILDFVLMSVQFFYKYLFLLRIDHFQRNKLLLQLIWYARKDPISPMILVVDLALLAIEGVVDLAAELNLV